MKVIDTNKLKPNDNKEFYVVHLKSRPHFFLKNISYGNLNEIYNFELVYLYDNGYWTLLAEALNDYSNLYNQHEIIRFSSVEEAEKSVFNFINSLENESKNTFSKDSFEIFKVQASINITRAKEFKDVGSVLNIGKDLLDKILRFETYFTETPLGKKMNSSLDSMKKLRKSDLKGYHNEVYNKHYDNWLEVNNEK